MLAVVCFVCVCAYSFCSGEEWVREGEREQQFNSALCSFFRLKVYDDDGNNSLSLVSYYLGEIPEVVQCYKAFKVVKILRGFRKNRCFSHIG